MYYFICFKYYSGEADPRKFQTQTSWSGNPTQSRSFRVLQKITGSDDEPQGNSTTNYLEFIFLKYILLYKVYILLDYNWKIPSTKPYVYNFRDNYLTFQLLFFLYIILINKQFVLFYPKKKKINSVDIVLETISISKHIQQNNPVFQHVVD